MQGMAVRPAKPTMVPGLEVHEAEDGFVIYDESTDRVHHLNNSAAVILHLCDGEHDAAGVAALVAEAFNLDAPPLEDTEATLETLAAQGLIE